MALGLLPWSAKAIDTTRSLTITLVVGDNCHDPDRTNGLTKRTGCV